MPRWTRDLDPAARLRIVCLPSAGGGTVDYRQWRVPEGVQVLPIVPPGRENRLTEPAFREMAPLVSALADALEAALDRPFALFGHSMGSWVGFELIRELRRRRWPMPRHLFASGRRAPDVPDRQPALHAIPSDSAFLAALQERYQAIPAQLLAQPDILALFLPALRADFTLLETWRPATEGPIAVPISAWAGARDATVNRADLQAWAAHTSAAFALRLFPGGHFYHRDERDEVVDAVLDACGVP